MHHVEQQRDEPGLVDLTGLTLGDLLVREETVLTASLQRLMRDAAGNGDDPIAAFNSSI